MKQTPRAGYAEAPARGIFPLDHRAECRPQMKVFLSCLRDAARGDASLPRNAAAADHAECRELSKAYLSCRMERGLMAQEDLDTLGFSSDGAPTPTTVGGGGGVKKEPEELLAGLGSARRAKMGILFGLGSGDSKRKTATHGD